MWLVDTVCEEWPHADTRRITLPLTLLPPRMASRMPCDVCSL